MLLFTLIIYDNGLTEHDILLANSGPIDIKNLLNSLAMVRLSDIVSPLHSLYVDCSLGRYLCVVPQTSMGGEFHN